MSVALISSQGTACAETVLHDHEDTPENRHRIDEDARRDRSSDAPIPGLWTDVSDNDYLEG